MPGRTVSGLFDALSLKQKLRQVESFLEAGDLSSQFLLPLLNLLDLKDWLEGELGVLATVFLRSEHGLLFLRGD